MHRKPLYSSTNPFLEPARDEDNLSFAMWLMIALACVIAAWGVLEFAP